MRKKSENKKGFTLAELLVVVAIIAVLVAIAIPVFGAALEKSREAADLANIRAAYAEATTEYLSDGGEVTAEVKNIQQTQPGWSTKGDGVGGRPVLYTRINGTETKKTIPIVIKGESLILAIDEDGNLTMSNPKRPAPAPPTT